MKRLYLFLLLVVITGCVSSDPTPEGLAVKIYEEKPKHCEELGPITTSAYDSISEKKTMDIFRNLVVLKGGNAARISNSYTRSYTGVIVIGKNKYYVLEGYMYKCP